MQVYAKTKNDIETYFQQKGITIVTIQPEFAITAVKTPPKITDSQCLVECQSSDCIDKICCSPTINAPVGSQINLSQSAGHMVRKPHSSSDDVRQRFAVSTNPTGEKAKSLLSLNVSMLSTQSMVAEKFTSTPNALHHVDGRMVEEKSKEINSQVISAQEEERPKIVESHEVKDDEKKMVSMESTTVPVQTRITSTSSTASQNTTTPLQTED